MKNRLIISDSPAQTEDIGRKLAGELKDRNQNIFLFGELGAGKTTLLKGLGSGLGITDDVISPSFQLVRKYSGTDGTKLTHIDLYRLEDVTEILHLGWWELLEEEGVTAVEWADRAWKILPDDANILKISLISENKRRIEIITKQKDLSGN